MWLGEGKVHPQGSFSMQEVHRKIGNSGVRRLSAARLAGARQAEFEVTRGLFFFKWENCLTKDFLL